MSRQVIIYLPDPDLDRVEWAASDDSGRLLVEPASGSLEEAARAVDGQRVTLVLPGTAVQLAEVRIPGGSSARVQQAAPFALEEQLADDVDDLHFALGDKMPGDRWPVAVIARDTLEGVIARCTAAGLRPMRVIPEPLCLPAESRQDELPLWHALLDNDELVVRLDAQNGFSTERDFAALAFIGALKDVRGRRTEGPEAEEETSEAAPESAHEAVVALYHTEPQESLDLPVSLDIDWRPCEHRLALHAAGLATGAGINLLQGEYNPRRGLDRTWKPWRWTAALAAALGAIWFGSQWLNYQRLADEESWLDEQIGSAFKEALPDTRMRSPRRQIQNALSEGGGDSTDGFTARLAQITASLATQPQTELRSIGYRDGRFDLDLTTDAVPTFDALQAALSERGNLNMTVQSANRQDQVVRGRVRIE